MRKFEKVRYFPKGDYKVLSVKVLAGGRGNGGGEGGGGEERTEAREGMEGGGGDGGGVNGGGGAGGGGDGSGSSGTVESDINGREATRERERHATHEYPRKSEGGRERKTGRQRGRERHATYE